MKAACLLLLAALGGQPGPPKLAEPVLQGGLAPGWHDFGYARRGPPVKGALAVDFSGWSGWILARPGLEGRFGGLTFRYRAPSSFGDFLEVKLRTGDNDGFPRIRIGPEHRSPAQDGFVQVFIPMEQLNPDGAPFDRIFFKAVRSVGKEWVLLDGLGLTAPDPSRPPLPKPPPREVQLAVDCRSLGKKVSPLIYGIASSPRLDAPLTQLGATAARWGGNTSSRYNWELGNAWNAGSDWFFRNLDYSNRPGFTYQEVLDHHLKLGVATALTVPMLGWVAKDTQAASFPVARFGAQQALDPDRDGIGNGLNPAGKPLKPGPPTLTSVAAPPSFVGRWVKAILQRDREKGVRSVALYFLDNEPELWNDTHRDVHPEALTYDELLSKTLAYGREVRRADPDALIAGPASWGWTAYFYSALDVEKGVHLRPDRRAHGDVPLLPWYLKQLRAHEQRTGERLLDLLDVHYYPQGKGLGLGDKGLTDPQSAAKRIRSTRSLWDPTYVDESWIDEPVELIPRLRRWVAENYPGRGISLGEYNFGAEGHQSGALAQAEALGRFGQEGLTAAFYWRAPPVNSPSFWAFRAYRNYDGQGATFLERTLPTRAAADASLFASRDEEGQKLVLIALNFDPKRAARARIDLPQCNARGPVKVFSYAGGPQGFLPGSAQLQEGRVDIELAAYSITVLELSFQGAAHE